MRARWVAGCGIGLLAVSPAAAQPLPPPYRSMSVFEAAQSPAGTRPMGATPVADCDRPSELPPLLPVPRADANSPRPIAPRGPLGEYDHGHFYLPERAPETVRSPEPPCGPDGRFWVGATLELGWTKAAHLPPLVRVGSATGPVVFGGEAARAPFRAGLGLAGGVWLDAEHARGVDASFYYLAEGSTDTVVFSNGTPLVLPTANGGAFPLADPAAGFAGAYQAGGGTRFTSADVNYRRNLFCGSGARLDGLVGYRYAHLGEDFAAFGKRIGLGGELVRFRDDATAANDFHGGQVGLAGEYRLDRWYLGATGKVAFGTVFTDTDANGKFRVNGTVVPAGFYARPGTSGAREHTRYGVMPTVGVTLGRQLGEYGRVFVGYNFLYLTNLTRGTDVFDPTPDVLTPDPLQLVAATADRRDANTSDFWAQSVNLGVEWRY